MDASLKLSPAPEVKSVQAYTRGITDILKAGFQSHASQETIQAALSALQTAFSVENTTVSGCTFTGDKTVNT